MMEEMNEVHEFMGKFRDDVETKWGLSIDPELGKKVKITILATGFGITNVPGIREKMNQEEQERLRELEEKQEENDTRREQFYGTNDRSGTSKKRPKVYLFGLDDLDNEEIISMVEITPTYKRTKEQLNDIKSKIGGDTVVVIEPEATNAIDMSASVNFLP
jgi:cell division protein FtsZ